MCVNSVLVLIFSFALECRKKNHMICLISHITKMFEVQKKNSR